MNEGPRCFKLWFYLCLWASIKLDAVNVAIRRLYRRARLKYILWKNPKLKDLQKLAGIKND
jgi:hypothetical protein